MIILQTLFRTDVILSQISLESIHYDRIGDASSDDTIGFDN